VPFGSVARPLRTSAPPQVRSLFGPDPMLKWKVAGAISTQLFMCWLVSDLTWPWVVALSYCIGGIINHSMTLAMHEISHNLAFTRPAWNRWFGMVANLPLGIPSSV
jgi:sphingolipid delta-4 desaturase